MSGRQHAAAEHHGRRLGEQLQPRGAARRARRSRRPGVVRRPRRRGHRLRRRRTATGSSPRTGSARGRRGAPPRSAPPSTRVRSGPATRRAARLRGRGRPRRGPPTTSPPARGTAPAPVAGDVADRREARVAAVAAAAGAVDPGAADRQRPRAVVGPARSRAKVSLTPRSSPPSRVPRSRPRAARARPAGRRWPGTRKRGAPRAGRRARPRGSTLDQEVQTAATAASAPDVRQAGAARRCQHLAVGRRRRDVGLAVAGVDGQHGRSSRPTAGTPGCRRAAGRSGPRRGRPGRPAGARAAPRRPGARPPCRAASSARCSYAVTCGDESGKSGASGATGAGHGAGRVDASPGPRSTASSARNGSVPPLRTLTSRGASAPPSRTRSAPPRPRSRTPRRAGSAARASSSSDGSPYSCSSCRSISATWRPATARSRCSRTTSSWA